MKEAALRRQTEEITAEVQRFFLEHRERIASAREEHRLESGLQLLRAWARMGAVPADHKGRVRYTAS